MQTFEFDYNLPKDLIAQNSAQPRDYSSLMIVDREKQTIERKHFYDIIDYLRPGDLLVWNNSKVFKARLFGKLLSSAGHELLEHKKPVEIFLVREMENEGVWKVLAKPGRHVQPGARVAFAADFYCDVIVKEPTGAILVQFPYNAATVRAKANQYGLVPLPSYIKDERHELDSYQTVYAAAEGSVAAPTAGFHFTPELIDKIKQKGIEFAEITLHIGLGTFLPIKSERVVDHTMHSEWVELSAENANKINQAKIDRQRVIAVGTTTTRTLEGIALLRNHNHHGKNSDNMALRDGRRKIVQSYSGDINLFILPGFKFQVVDALITNFHLPKSTLLVLVCAFAGSREFMLDCYRKAVDDQYRFYSFGDGMFIC